MRPTLAALFFLWLLFPQNNTAENLQPLLYNVSSAYARLEPKVIRPAEGYFKYDYLIPAGFYKQMWDWDGFFIGSHLAHQSREQAKYLKWWVLNFTGAVTTINKDGWVPGVLLADNYQYPSRVHYSAGSP